MTEPTSTWRGKPLDQYTKAELIKIVEQLGLMQQQESVEHSRQLDVLQGLIKQ
jgi:hypothetical protein